MANSENGPIPPPPSPSVESQTLVTNNIYVNTEITQVYTAAEGGTYLTQSPITKIEAGSKEKCALLSSYHDQLVARGGAVMQGLWSKNKK